MNPSTYLKAHKNETEIANTKDIHIQDGVAMVKFMYWLKNNYKKENITEFSAEEKINSLREKNRRIYRFKFFNYFCFWEKCSYDALFCS